MWCTFCIVEGLDAKPRALFVFGDLNADTGNQVPMCLSLTGRPTVAHGQGRVLADTLMERSSRTSSVIIHIS